MRKIAGPGHVSNEFADYDEITNPDGTVVTAQWANDVQRELIGIQDEFSIAEADGSNKYVLSAIIGLSIKHSASVGRLIFESDYIAPAAFDKDDPESFYPAVCLSTIEGKEDISASNYPTLVPELRSRPVYYERGKTGEKYQFDVTGWAIVSNVATLTFANTTAENEILSALSADNVVNGGYSDWQTITLTAAIGDIAAGDYNITDVDAVSRTISFVYTASNNSGSVTATVRFYRHRIAGSTTTARLFQISEDALMSVGGDRVSMFRQLDQMQRITGSVDNVCSGGSADGAFSVSATGNTFTSGSAPRYDVDFDSANSPNARTSATTDGQTRPKNTAAFVYMWAQSYVA
ncbi:MAG: hypothetical protein SVR04_00035 [Spirochaetota bacterium]|nr:hypothetical protein [Spirochaetota bacterium]